MLRPICATTMPTSPRGTIPRPIFNTFCQPSEMAPRPQPTSLVTTAAAKITSASAIVDRERKTPKFRCSPMPARKKGTSSSLTPRVNALTSERAPNRHTHGEHRRQRRHQRDLPEIDQAARHAADYRQHHQPE